LELGKLPSAERMMATLPPPFLITGSFNIAVSVHSLTLSSFALALGAAAQAEQHGL